MQRFAISLAAILAITLPVHAQSPAPSPDWSAAAVAGAGRTWDDEGVIGDGAIAGGRVARRIAGGTFIEASLDVLHHERADRFSAEGNTLFVSAAIVQRFGRGRAQPYGLGGVTLGRHRGTYGFLPDNKLSLAESTDTGFVYGGGLAVRAAGRFEVGPEIRFFTLRADTDSSPAIGYWVGARVGVRF
ncbi:MAG: hypothetical protein ABIX28_04120 [Vicinamibacterales bacterium]